MENEIMLNEEVMDTEVEVAEANSNRGLMLAAGIGLAVLVGVGIYKIVKKVKAKKAQIEEEALATIEGECEEIDEANVSELDD